MIGSFDKQVNEGSLTMQARFWKKVQQSIHGATRRDLFKQLGVLAAAQTLTGVASRAAGAPLDLGSKLYESIGVRPLLNAKGTFTIITGSQSLPEVKRAMEE